MAPRGFVLRRVAQALLVIALSYTLVFFTLFVLPGDPIENKINNPLNPLPEGAAERLLGYYDLDRSPVEQYVLAVQRLFTGDLGFSLVNGHPVGDLVRDALGDTLALAGTALVFAIALSLAVALVAVFAPFRLLRNAAAALPLIFLSTPSFLVGFLLLQVFAFQLGWVSSIRDQGFVSVILPAAALAIAVSAPIAQVLIQGLARASAEPFVGVLRAKGMSESSIIGRHVLKNGSIPAVTLLALTTGELLAGSVVIETVFTRTGLGFITQQAVREQDSPVILAVVVLVSAIFVLVGLLTDLVYPLLDPRISFAAPRPLARIKREVLVP